MHWVGRRDFFARQKLLQILRNHFVLNSFLKEVGGFPSPSRAHLESCTQLGLYRSMPFACFEMTRPSGGGDPELINIEVFGIEGLCTLYFCEQRGGSSNSSN